MQIEYIDIDKVMPYENNPRLNDDAVEYVKNSILEFGFKVPIIIDASNVIVCGHTRYKAAKELMMQSIPCIKADDLSEKQVAAYRLADNKVAEFAKWDYELLDEELSTLSEMLVDMEQFGFYEIDDSYIDNLFDDEDEQAESTEKEQEQDNDSDLCVVVRFDTKEELENFIGYCEQEGLDYESGVNP